MADSTSATPPSPPDLGVPALARPLVEAIAAGSLIGLVDIFLSESSGWSLTAVFVAGVALGVRHAGRAWPCWAPLGVGLYAVHVVAIACGRRPPFVEASFQAARETLFLVFPAGIGLVLGTSVRFGVSAFGRFPRKNGPPVRLFPRSTRGALIAVAEIALTMGLIRWVALDSTTIYAAGYNEGRFQQVVVGMNPAQVEAMLGRPIHQADWGDPDLKNWIYSQGASSTSNYSRRWILFRGGQVETVISDYWWD